MMDRHEQLTFSMLLSPAELVIWHGMGALVNPRRHAALKAELGRPHVPDRHAAHRRELQAKVMQGSKKKRFQGLVPGLGRKGQPVVMDGVRYDSAEAAGRALGVHGVTVRRSINCGRPVGKLAALKISGKGVSKGAQRHGGNGETAAAAAAAAAGRPAGDRGGAPGPAGDPAGAPPPGGRQAADRPRRRPRAAAA